MGRISEEAFLNTAGWLKAQWVNKYDDDSMIWRDPLSKASYYTREGAVVVQRHRDKLSADPPRV